MKPRRVVNKKVSEQPSHSIEGLGALLVTSRVAQSERGCVAATEYNVVIVQVSHDIVGLTQELREGPFDDAHTRMISELLQMFTSSEGSCECGEPESRWGLLAPWPRDDPDLTISTPAETMPSEALTSTEPHA